MKVKKVLGFGGLFVLVAGLVCGGMWFFMEANGEEDVAAETGEPIESEAVSVGEMPESTSTGGEEVLGDTGAGTASGAIEVRIVSAEMNGERILVAGEAVTTDVSGTCEYVFTATDGTTKVVASELVKNPATVSCVAIDEEISEFGAGPWRVKLVYTVGGARSESAEVSVD